MNLLKKLLHRFLAFMFITVMRCKVAIAQSPLPFIHWVRRQPDPGPTAPSDYSEYEGLVAVQRDLVYPSAYKSNTLDLYYPKDGREQLPTIFWIHGGSFIAGDKSGTAYWCTVMASKGYTVVSMNYEVAPEAKYPAPLRQMAEVYRYLTTVVDHYPTLDVQRLIVGGDSAGAQIASQFLAIQTNPELARLSGLQQTIPPQALKAALLYCGPYNVKQLANAKGMAKFFMNMLGWSYLGVRHWQDSSIAQQASTVNYVTRDYPPAFITDGNTSSFEKHGIELAERLKALGVPVSTLFFPLSEGVVNHEYQFHMDQDEAQHCLELTLTFLADSIAQAEITKSL